ncbi:MAG: OmpA family protein [Myxococcaceae bacterium]
MTRTVLASLFALFSFAAQAAEPPAAGEKVSFRSITAHQAPAEAPAQVTAEVGKEADAVNLSLGRSSNGGAGLYRLRSAFIAPRTVSFSAHGGFFRQAALTASSGTDEYHLAVVGAAYAPSPWLELSATSKSATLSQPAAAESNQYLVNDLTVRGKLGSSFYDGSLALAAEVSVRLPPPLLLSPGISPQAGGLLSYDFTSAGAPVVAHLGTGFVLDNSYQFDDGLNDRTRQLALGITTYNQWQSAAGLEARLFVAGVGVVPFVEWTMDAPLGAPGGLGASPMRLAPGVRVMPWRGLSVEAVVELGLRDVRTPGVPPLPGYLAVLALGYQVGVDPPRAVSAAPPEQGPTPVLVVEKPTEAPARTGVVRGVVKDQATSKPLADAVVTLPGRNRLLADASGGFTVSDVGPGPLTVRAQLPGYAERQVEGKVTAGGELVVDLGLTALPPPPPPKVTVKGTVISEADALVSANIAVPTAGLEPKAFKNGDYELQVPAGEHTVEVSAPGFLKQARRLVAKPGETVAADFVMREAPRRMLVVLRKEKLEIKKQVHFATNREVILPDSSPLLDEVASTLLGTPRLQLIRIEGHTDSQGNASYNLQLSDRRARSVMRALVERGVEPSRLRAVGFGDGKPIAENRKASGRAANRRVEFMIEEQD